MKKLLFLSVIFCFALLSLQAQTCCSGGVPVSGNIGFQSSDAKVLQVSLGADFNFLNTLFLGSEKNTDAFRERRTQSYLLRGAYSFTKRFSTEMLFPMVRQTRRIKSNLGTEDFDASFGVGDPLILLNYDLVKKPFNFRIGAGPQFPLGSYTETDSRGILLGEDLQPGSGAWDFIFFSSLEKKLSIRPTGLLYFNAIYNLNGKNADSRGGNQTYHFGNETQLILGYSDQLLLFKQIITPGFALRYRKASRDEIDGVESSGTGGEWLFLKLTNGFQFLRDNSLVINLEIPIYTFVNDTQLSPDFILNVSWYKSIELKNKKL